MIIFIAEVWGPFLKGNMPDVPGIDTTLIYGFSPDGVRAGALTPAEPESSAAIYLPSPQSDKPMLVEFGVNFDHPAVKNIELPPECYPQADSIEYFFHCTHFQYSPDGRYLGFHYGAASCGHNIMILNTQTGEIVYQLSDDIRSGHGFKLLKNGKALIASGHCEGGYLSLVNLNNGTERELGDSGYLAFNADQNAFFVEVTPYQGIQNSIYGFNLNTNQYFMRVPEELQIDDHPIWTPDSRYMLYQHCTLFPQHC